MRLRSATAEEIEIARAIDSAFRLSRGSLGLRYEPIAQLPPAVRRISRTFPVYFIDAGYDLVRRENRRFAIDIDGARVAEFDPTFAVADVSQQAVHVARLRLGRHSVQIRDAAGGRPLYDGDILVNGIDAVQFEIYPCEAAGCRVVVLNGVHIKFGARP